MENNLKRLSVITAALFSLFPLSHAQADPLALDFTTGYVITLEGYFAQPQLSGSQQYVGSFPQVSPILNSQINAGSRFGFYTSVLYQFTNTPYNLFVSYNHLDTDDNTQAAPSTLQQMTTTSTLDEIDLNAGRNFVPIQPLKLRIALGARYTHLRFKSSFADTNTTTGVANSNGAANADTSGVGPNLALDANYLIAYGFGLAVHANAAAIWSNINLTQGDIVLTDPAHNYTAKNQSQVIPNLGTHAGISYTYVSENYNFNGEAGYLIDYYGSAIMLDNVTPEHFTGIYFRGPYLRFSLGF